MRSRNASLAVAFLALCVSCTGSRQLTSSKGPGPERPLLEPNGLRAAATAPAPRVVGRWNLIFAYQQAFFRAEGPSRRGRRFARLARALEEQITAMEGNSSPSARNQSKLTELEALALLGPPDFTEFEDTRTVYVYLFEQADSFFAKPTDRALVLSIDSNGVLTHIGATAAVGNLGLKRMQRYAAIAPPDEPPQQGEPPRAVVRSGYLGILMTPADEPDVDPGAVIILRVLPRSPASRVDLLAGDTIERIDGQQSNEEVGGSLVRRKAGEEVRLTVRRGNAAPREVRATLDPWPATQPSPIPSAQH